MNKTHRLSLFYAQLGRELPCSTFKEAYDLLHNTMNAIENRWTDIPFDVTYPMNSERMYAPLMDSRRNSLKEDIVRFRNRFNYTFISKTGAILITDLQFKPIFDKEDSNGNRINI